MGSILTDILAFIVAISVLVAIHEFGHYIVGRWAGMKVLRFSIGFGSPIWSKRAGKDNTEYCVAGIPLGGYVKFLDTREGPIASEDEGRAFDQRPIPWRVAVLLAGPLFNFLFAIVAYWVLMMPGEQGRLPVIGEVVADSYAERSGIQSGDRILEIDGKPTDNWQDALLGILDSMVANGEIPMLVQSEGGTRRSVVVSVGDDSSRLTEPGVLFEGLGISAGYPPPVIGEFTENSAAQDAGLRTGDRLLSIDGTDVRYYEELPGVLRDAAGERVEVVYERFGQTRRADVTIGETGTGEARRGVLGVYLHEDMQAHYWYSVEYSLGESLVAGVVKTWDMSVFTIKMLAGMLTGDVSFKNISGPINIAQFAGDSAERGWDPFISFLAVISISLGILNLLPVPVLDGGQIVYQVAEGVKGSPLTERTQILGQQIGILALLLLMSFAFYNDIARTLG